MRTTTKWRTAAAMAAAGVLLAGLTACTPEATPTPTPTSTAAFESDEEAFQAAEETYERYVAALSAVDLEDADTFEPVLEWTTEGAQSDERKSLSQLSAQELTMTGTTGYRSFTPLRFDADAGRVVAHVCIDVSDVDLLGPDGVSVVPPNRPALQPLEVEFASAKTSTALALARSDATESFTCPAE